MFRGSIAGRGYSMLSDVACETLTVHLLVYMYCTHHLSTALATFLRVSKPSLNNSVFYLINADRPSDTYTVH